MPKKKLKRKSLPWTDMSDREQALLSYLATVPEAHHTTIQDNVFGDLGTGTSTTRNTLRRLIEFGHAVKVSGKTGAFAATARGRRTVPEEAQPIADHDAEPVLEHVELTKDMDLAEVEIALLMALKILKGHRRSGKDRREAERRGHDRRDRMNGHTAN